MIRLWHRLGTTLFRSGEHFYNFQGLRAYKQKFDPEWKPRYLACPGGLALPGVLLEVRLPWPRLERIQVRLRRGLTRMPLPGSRERLCRPQCHPLTPARACAAHHAGVCAHAAALALRPVAAAQLFPGGACARLQACMLGAAIVLTPTHWRPHP